MTSAGRFRRSGSTGNVGVTPLHGETCPQMKAVGMTKPGQFSEAGSENESTHWQTESLTPIGMPFLLLSPKTSRKMSSGQTVCPAQPESHIKSQSDAYSSTVLHTGTQNKAWHTAQTTPDMLFLF